MFKKHLDARTHALENNFESWAPWWIEFQGSKNIPQWTKFFNLMKNEIFLVFYDYKHIKTPKIHFRNLKYYYLDLG